MGWLGPLNGGSWLLESAKKQQPRSPLWKYMRTVGGVKSTADERKAKAKELAKLYSRARIAQLMNVDPSTVTKWLGAKNLEKRPYGKRP